VGRRADDAIELRAVVADEADILDDDVVDLPAVAGAVDHPRFHGHFRPLLRDDLAADDGVLAIGLLLSQNGMLCANAVLPSAGGSLRLTFNLAWWRQTTPANKSHGRNCHDHTA